ncbi:MAG: hypothetical protein H6Q26_207 [Bacteroidetes bacterium]|uniref:hypothetical protein n=1 Tax=unclassified Chitinophaga TaxID=2619133 RepID=UPI001DA2110F|nr:MULTISPECIES: hypothetical protein [unclassified Chitinophaga]MBP1650050.1 hypothetical protein [Bacteroidota bacterium]WPV69719.1 hypothetical protein QQL36_13530 [Chitinophaga sp. LS1]
MRKFPLLLLLIVVFSLQVSSQGLDNLYRLSNAKTRSISPENLTGEKGKGGMASPSKNAPPNTANASDAARDLGQGWKVNPFIIIKPGQTV